MVIPFIATTRNIMSQKRQWTDGIERLGIVAYDDNDQLLCCYCGKLLTEQLDDLSWGHGMMTSSFEPNLFFRVHSEAESHKLIDFFSEMSEMGEVYLHYIISTRPNEEL